MRKKIVHAAVALLLFGLAGCDVTKRTDANSAPKALPTIVAKTQGMQAMPGYFPIYWDGKEGKVWLEIGRFDSEFLYVVSLASGVGSNDIGLDRGEFGDLEVTASPEHVVKFDRVGSKVLLIEQNFAYRAVTKNPAEKRAVEQSFARSVLWGFKVEAEENGRVLVDATSFLLNDAHGVAGKLKDKKQGTYKVDEGAFGSLSSVNEKFS